VQSGHTLKRNEGIQDFRISSGSLAMLAAIRRAILSRGYGTDRNQDHHEKNDLRDDA
jgi:hypothetical protein